MYIFSTGTRIRLLLRSKFEEKGDGLEKTFDLWKKKKKPRRRV
jgi:hypothetical protein